MNAIESTIPNSAPPTLSNAPNIKILMVFLINDPNIKHTSSTTRNIARKPSTLEALSLSVNDPMILADCEKYRLPMAIPSRIPPRRASVLTNPVCHPINMDMPMATKIVKSNQFNTNCSLIADLQTLT